VADYTNQLDFPWKGAKPTTRRQNGTQNAVPLFVGVPRPCLTEALYALKCYEYMHSHLNRRLIQVLCFGYSECHSCGGELNPKMSQEDFKNAQKRKKVHKNS